MSLAIARDADLGARNTFGVPARARLLAELRDEADAPSAVALAEREGRLPFVLGGGSNLLITRDLDEPVLAVATRGIRFEPAPSSGRREGGHAPIVVEAAAGESWDGLVRATLAAGLAGLENLALIPGQVGASPIQNIGAYGVELRERFDSLRAIDLRDGRIRRFDAADCRFGYRDSFFKTPEGRHWLVLAVRFALSPLGAAPPRTDYAELGAELAARGAEAGTAATAVAVAEAVSAIRRRKLPDPRVVGNAGSFFKNPIVPAAQAAALRERHAELPVHPAADGRAKLSAGWLIERAGFKGTRRGDAGVSERHALVLVNHGRATGAELLALAREIQAGVRARFGVTLEPEPVIV